MMLLLVLLGCGEPGPRFVPVTDWRGTQDVVTLASQPRFTVETARDAALAAGVTIAETDPNLAGSWMNRRDLEDKILESLVLRQRPAPGVYNYVQTLYIYEDLAPQMRVELTGIEVFGANRACTYVVKARFSYVDEPARRGYSDAEAAFAPDVLNAEPCDEVASLGADAIEYRDSEGKTFTETRRKPGER